MKSNKKIKTPQRGERNKKINGARPQLRHGKVRVKIRDRKNKIKKRSKVKKEVSAAAQLREVDLAAEKYSRTGFRVPPKYKMAITALGKLMRSSQTYGSDLSESAVVVRLVADKCRELKVFS